MVTKIDLWSSFQFSDNQVFFIYFNGNSYKNSNYVRNNEDIDSFIFPSAG